MPKDWNKNPWKTLKSSVVYDNPWIKVVENDVVNPVGGPGIYGVVHFKNIAVGVVPLDDDNNTWLVGQYRYTLNAYSWEIPEGGCLIGQETPLIAAQRELLEETGLKAERWTEVLKMHTSNSVTDEVAYTFLAKGLSVGLAQPEDTEELMLRKLPFEEAFQMCLKQEITDAFSVGSLFKVKYMLEQGGC
jgi:8-oxo-dGTP pyrophosphatase MutT (NUDIX family)